MATKAQSVPQNYTFAGRPQIKTLTLTSSVSTPASPGDVRALKNSSDRAWDRGEFMAIVNVRFTQAVNATVKILRPKILTESGLHYAPRDYDDVSTMAGTLSAAE